MIAVAIACGLKGIADAIRYKQTTVNFSGPIRITTEIVEKGEA